MKKNEQIANHLPYHLLYPTLMCDLRAIAHNDDLRSELIALDHEFRISLGFVISPDPFATFTLESWKVHNV